MYPRNFHTLPELLQEVDVVKLSGEQEVLIQAISFDSRTTKPATLFVAVKGTKVDGHDYIPQAIEAGSTAIVCEQMPSDLAEQITYVQVQDSARALGVIASNFYGRPSYKLCLVAVTGTNGKTSTVHLLCRLFDKLGYRVGMCSTIYNQVGTETTSTTHTTLDAIRLNELLAHMVKEGCQYGFIEVSSHAIAQKRIAGIQFDGAVFLNVTHDHLDYHQTFEAYLQAKKTLFDDLASSAFALYNADDRRGPIVVQNTQATTHSFALKTPATFTAKLLTSTLQGSELKVDEQSVWTRLVGNFNAYNLLAAYATACLLGEETLEVLTALSSIESIQGRFQQFRAQTGFHAIVDYAHTPDALRQVLSAIRQSKEKEGKIITVVGCGGDRDSDKRPIMAQVAWASSDSLIFTADNPRTEDPLDIISDMQAGLSPTQQQKVLVILDRAEAIKTACQLAKQGDIVLIAGKGHETYQEVNGKRHPFDDREVLKNFIGPAE